MVKTKKIQKDKQYNGQNKKNKRTNNIMVKTKKIQKDKQYTGQNKKNKGQTI